MSILLYTVLEIFKKLGCSKMMKHCSRTLTQILIASVSGWNIGLASGHTLYHRNETETTSTEWTLDGTENNSSINGTENNNTQSHDVSTLWYLVCFGGLVTFFLIISVSEFCCKTHHQPPPAVSEEVIATTESNLPQPPPYSLFAPPNYDSLFNSKRKSRKTLQECKMGINEIQMVQNNSNVPVEPSPEPALEFGEVIRRNPMGEDEVVTPPPPP